jgi:hypothetical protein
MGGLPLGWLEQSTTFIDLWRLTKGWLDIRSTCIDHWGLTWGWLDLNSTCIDHLGNYLDLTGPKQYMYWSLSTYRGLTRTKQCMCWSLGKLPWGDWTYAVHVLIIGGLTLDWLDLISICIDHWETYLGLIGPKLYMCWSLEDLPRADWT